jgi:hypothetical protein
MYFTVSYDTAVKAISAAIMAILVVVAWASQSGMTWAVGALIVLLCFAWSPRGYRVENRWIVVNRLAGKARIALDDVREVRETTGDDFTGCIRLFGNGGVFGYYGLFRTTKLGKTTWYLTNRKRSVLVVTGSKTVLFSPDDLEGFLAAIRSSVPVAEASADRPVLSRGLSSPGRSAKPTGMIIGGAVALVALIVVAFTLLYSPGPPSYTLTSEALTIHDRFYPVTLPRANVEVDGIRVVSFAADPEWAPVERTNGFANGHYHSGTFRLASGQKVRMYRAEGKELVLLPGKGNGTTVLLETPDPDKFMAAVKQVWGTASP